MDIACLGGGPAGLYFAILMRKLSPQHRVRIYERNRPDDTFGFGVVFSDATLEELREADPDTLDEIEASFAHWDDIESVTGPGAGGARAVRRSTGHGFSGLGRKRLLAILQERALELGVELHHEHDLDPHELSSLGSPDLLVAADGVNSGVRERFADTFQPRVDWRPNRFVWLGTTFPFEAFTFYFKENEHGLFRVHAYRYAEGSSTFIVECTEETWRSAKLNEASEDETVAYCEQLFADELAGHRLLKNRSVWRQFPTIDNGRWSTELVSLDGGSAKTRVVLLGDALHTAHFSIGSGTKLAMESGIALRDAIASRPDDLGAALMAFEAERRPTVASLQRAAQVSLEWFENTERYLSLEPDQFFFSLLTRSLRITHENLKLRDPALIAGIDSWVRQQAGAQSKATVNKSAPPMFTPYRARELVLPNRIVVSPMCQYSATEGTIDDWHLVHLGSRAMGGAGLVLTEATHVSADGRISPGCAGLYTDEHEVAWKRVVDFVHGKARGLIGMQLAHAGRKASTAIPWEGGNNAPLKDGAWPICAPSALPFYPESQTPLELDAAGMKRVVGEFVQAAERAARAGFDWLELHAAHGYLLSSFISPLSNRRSDEYGGNIDGRARFPLRVFRAVREVWPDERPISVRISASDWADGGLSTEDLLRLAVLFREAGVDLLDVSTGQTVPEAKPRYGRLYQTPFAELIRLETGMPTMTVGAISSWADANSIIAGGRADLCMLARGHLYDPYWTRHAAREQGFELPWPNQYMAVARYTPR